MILTVGDITLSTEHVSGDLTCFGSMMLFASYLALARRNRDFPSLWTYVVPLYFTGGILCFAAAIPVTDLTQTFAPREYLYLLALAVIPTIIGHSTLNYSLKHMRGQLVSVCNLTQFIFAGIMAVFAFGEIPAWTFYLAAALIVLGAAVTIRAHPEACAMP
jgi:drug/metabolite transporter (DMT)-like permease